MRLEAVSILRAAVLKEKSRGEERDTEEAIEGPRKPSARRGPEKIDSDRPRRQYRTETSGGRHYPGLYDGAKSAARHASGVLPLFLPLPAQRATPGGAAHAAGRKASAAAQGS